MRATIFTGEVNKRDFGYGEASHKRFDQNLLLHFKIRGLQFESRDGCASIKAEAAGKIAYWNRERPAHNEIQDVAEFLPYPSGIGHSTPRVARGDYNVPDQASAP